MSVIPLEENDEFDDIVDDLEELQRGFLSMESTLAEISRKSNQFAVEGICRSDAVALEMLDPELIRSHYPVNSYTVAPSKTNLTITKESLWNKTQRVFEAIWNMILDLFERIAEAFKSVRDKVLNRDPKAPAKKANSDLQKTKDAFAKEESRVKDTVSTFTESGTPKGANLQQQLSDIQNFKTPAMAEAYEVARNSYTTLARMVVTQPKQIEYICDQFKNFPMMARYVMSMSSSLTDALNKAANTGHLSAEYIRNIMDHEKVSADTQATFTTPIANLYEALPPSSKPPKYTEENTGTSIEFSTEIRNSFRRAATEPSGKVIEDDFGDDLIVLIRNRERSVDALSGALKLTTELDKLWDELKSHDKRIKSIRSKARAVEIEGPHATEIRNAIITHTRLLRSYMMTLINLRISLNYIVRATERNIVATARLYALGTNELRRLR